MNRFALPDHAESLLPEGKKWKLVWHDEFDGTQLDRSKWDFRLNFWGKRFPAFTDQGVELDGRSHLKLHVVRTEDGRYVSPHLQTASLTCEHPKDHEGFWPCSLHYPEPKFLHKFGYYEIRCRLNRQAGWWTAFWLQSPSIGMHPNPEVAGVECDIMESQHYPEQGEIKCGNIWGGYGADCKNPGHAHFPLKKQPDDWHYFGVDWSPEGYTFYADGEVVHREGPPVSHTEQFILVSTECMGYRRHGIDSKHDARLDNVVLPEYFEVDHVRVFDQVQ